MKSIFKNDNRQLLNILFLVYPMPLTWLICWWWDSNCGRLVLQMTTQPTSPQPSLVIATHELVVQSGSFISTGDRCWASEDHQHGSELQLTEAGLRDLGSLLLSKGSFSGLSCSSVNRIFATAGFRGKKFPDIGFTSSVVPAKFRQNLVYSEIKKYKKLVEFCKI